MVMAFIDTSPRYHEFKEEEIGARLKYPESDHPFTSILNAKQHTLSPTENTRNPKIGNDARGACLHTKEGL